MKTLEKNKLIIFLVTVLLLSLFMLSFIVVNTEITRAEDILVENSISLEKLHANTNNPNKSDNMPNLTILTHGIGANALAWSSGSKKEITIDDKTINVTRLKCDNESLIESLRLNNPDVEILYAYNFNKNNNAYTYNLDNLIAQGNGKEYAYKEKTEFTIEDTAKHFVILYESSLPNQGNSEEYEVFHYFVDSIIYKLKLVGVDSPTLNLIGHGRGGIVNTMYTVEHYYNVNSIFNIAAPLNGSGIIPIANDLIDILGISNSTEDNSGNANSLLDKIGFESCEYLNEMELLGQLKMSWNDANIGDIVNAHAISSSVSIKAIKKLAEDMQSILNLAKGLMELEDINTLLTLIYENRGALGDFIPEILNIAEFMPMIVDIRNAENIFKLVEVMRKYVEKMSDYLSSDQKDDLKNKLDKAYDGLNAGQFAKWLVVIEVNKKFPGLNITKEDLYGEKGTLVSRGRLMDFFSAIKISGVDGEEVTVKDYLVNIIPKNDYFTLDNLFGAEEFDSTKIKELILKLINPEQIESIKNNLSKLNEFVGYIDKHPNVTGGFSGLAQNKLGKLFIEKILIPILCWKYDSATLDTIASELDYDKVLDFVSKTIKRKSDTDFASSKWDSWKLWEQEILLLTDIFVEHDSQSAQGYEGFRVMNKLYESLSNDGYTNPNLPIPIPHNMETKDKEIIKYIINNIQIQASFTRSELNVVSIDDKRVEVVGIKDVKDEIIIPDTIYGKTVVGIGDGAFKGLSFSSITLPETLRYIGEEAFANNCALQKVELPNSCNVLGKQAFANCTNLEDINISSGLVEIGENAFYNCPNIVFTAAEDSYYQIQDNTLLNPMRNTIIKVGKYLNEQYVVSEGITNIEEFAFAGVSIKEITLNEVQKIGRGAFKDSMIERIVATDSLQHVGVDALIGTPWLENQTGDHIILGSVYLKYNGENSFVDISSVSVSTIGAGAFANKDITNVSLPSTLKYIDEYAFYKCTNLELIHIDEDVVQIGSKAFAGCENLVIDFRGAYPPVIAVDAFYYCGDNLIIRVPYLNKEKYKQDLAFKLYQENVTTKTSKIFFETNCDCELEEQYQLYYSLIDTLPILEREGYNFDGWYLNEELVSIGSIWLHEDDVKLYAKWSLINYSINYEYNGAEEVDNIYAYTVEDVILFNEPYKYGYEFGGWYTNSSCEGDNVIGIQLGTTGNITVYAKWLVKTVSVVLNANATDVEIEDPSYRVTFDTIFEFPVPMREGYSFIGWYVGQSNQSRQLTDSSGKSLATWDIAEDIQLYAQWQAYKYTFKIYSADGSNLWINENGITTERAGIEYDYPISIYDAITTYFQTHYRTGWIYSHYITNYDNNYEYAVTVPYLGADGAEIRIYPQYVREKYTIYCYDGGDIVQKVEALYDGPVDINSLHKEGMYFAGWEIVFASSDVEGTDYAVGKRFNANLLSMPDLSPKEGSNATLSLRAIWLEEKTNIILDEFGDYEIIKIKKGDFLTRLPNPERRGYIFKGWYDDEGNRYYNLTEWSGPYGNLILHAEWELINYNIMYIIDENTENDNPIQYNVESVIILNAPIKIGYRFNGWKDENGNSVLVIPIGTTGDITLTASWIGKSYNYDQISEVKDIVTIIDFTNAGNMINKKYSISDSVSEVTFIGNGEMLYDMQIYVEERESDLILCIANFSFSAPTYKNAITADVKGTIILNSIGSENAIVGGINNSIENVTSAIFANHLIVNSKGNLSIWGGNGRDGSDSIEDGMIGGIGIKAKTIDFSGNIEIIGGSGGQGGQGAEGLSGVDGKDGVATSTKENSGKGEDGTDGRNGEKGATGGNGNSAIIAEKITIATNSAVVVVGGSGGRGGQGGQGGRGGNGGNGANYSGIYKAGNGGNSGNGGNGGQGGDGGQKAEIVVQVNIIEGNFEVVNGNAGLGGEGGLGGQAGTPGRGGNVMGGSVRPDGQNGTDGIKGQCGVNGN